MRQICKRRSQSDTIQHGAVLLTTQGGICHRALQNVASRVSGLCVYFVSNGSWTTILGNGSVCGVKVWPGGLGGASP
jgi:hypothetical protein